MSNTFSWSFKVQVTGGPSINVTDTFQVDAYDKIEATVPNGGSATVNVQPGDGARFLMITADDYENLTFTVDGNSNPHTTSDYELDGAHILIGEGAVSLLGTTQQQLVFSNAGTEDAVVTILVGRDATP